MTRVFENEHYRLLRLPAGVHHLIRSERRFADEGELREAHAPLLEALERARPRALLVDLRHAPSSNDPAFESAMATYRKRFLTAAPKAAVLVRSKAGLLQVQRLARQDGTPASFFEDERRAIAWLEAP
jgi:hypothetical protein